MTALRVLTPLPRGGPAIPTPVWVAVAPLFIGLFRAHNVGDVVPDGNVAIHGWDVAGLVQRVTYPDDGPAAMPRPLSSTTVARIEYLTLAEYTALAVKDPSTLYITY